MIGIIVLNITGDETESERSSSHHKWVVELGSKLKFIWIQNNTLLRYYHLCDDSDST